jgi:hypothetical protein
LARLVESAGATGTWPTNAGTVTTGSYTPVKDSLQVAIAVCGNGDNNPSTALAISDSVSGSWTTLQTFFLTTGAMAGIFAKDAGASPAAQTVTATFTSPTEGSGLIVRQVSGNVARAAAQLGARVQSGAAGSGTYTASITPKYAGSLIVGGYGQSTASVTLTANAATSIYNQGNGSGGDTLAALEALAPPGPGNAVTLGFTNTGTASQIFVLVEIIPAAVPAPFIITVPRHPRAPRLVPYSAGTPVGAVPSPVRTAITRLPQHSRIPRLVPYSAGTPVGAAPASPSAARTIGPMQGRPGTVPRTRTQHGPGAPVTVIPSVPSIFRAPAAATRPRPPIRPRTPSQAAPGAPVLPPIPPAPASGMPVQYPDDWKRRILRRRMKYWRIRI